jgi:hypothetical protein
VERGLAKLRHERWTNMTELGEALALWLYGHGIKEDLSGNSIRAVWLDGEISGLRADLPSTGEYPAADSGGANLVRQAKDHARRTFQTTAGFEFSPRFRTRNIAIVIALVALGTIAATLGFRSNSEPAALPTAMPPPAATVSISPLGGPTKGSTQDEPRSNVTPRAASDETSGAPPAPNTMANPSASRARTPKPTPPPPKPPARPSSTKQTHDFGF